MYRYLRCCVAWPARDVDSEGGLSDMIDSGLNISRRCFMSHVDIDELKALECDLGYQSHPSQGLTMAGDYHVAYKRGKLHGETVYFFVHSAIEYVFVKEKEL